MLAAAVAARSYAGLTILRRGPVTWSLLRGCSSNARDPSHVDDAKPASASRFNAIEESRLDLDPVPVPEEASEAETEVCDQAIYQGLLSAQIRLVKCFSLMTSAIGLAAQPVLFMKAQTHHPVFVIATGAFLSFFTFATPLLIHFISKKYVTEMYYNKAKDSYTAVTYSLLLRRKKITFSKNDVLVPDLPGMFTTFKVGDVPLFVDGQQFSAPQHYVKLMGYDKPIDLRWRDGMTKSHADAVQKKDERQSEQQ